MRKLTVVLLVLIIVGGVAGYIGGIDDFDYYTLFKKLSIDRLVGGEHTRITYDLGEQLIIGNGDEVRGRWCQTGYAEGANSEDNKLLVELNPEIFTLDVKIRCTGAGDSADVCTGYFEWCDDTTETDMINLSLTDIDQSFTVGELVTGNASNAYGTIKSITAGVAGDTILTLHSVEGVFDTATPDTIVGGTSGASDPLAAKSSIWDRSAWNADSSNYFINGACYSHLQYGDWRFYTLHDTSRRYLYPVRNLLGGYTRPVWASILDGDSLYLDGKLHGEN